MAMNSRERVARFLAADSVDRLPTMPVVMMFCADYIGVKYGTYVQDPQVLAEAQIRTAEAFDLDIVSNMSDPAREAHDCGAQVCFFDDQPAAIDEQRALLSDKQRLGSLELPDPLAEGRMHAAVRALEEMRQRVGQSKFVMGWVEGPCAEAADLRGINAWMLDLYDDPRFVHDLLEFVLEMALGYARAQVDAGADLIGIGDAAASLVGPKLYDKFIWPYEKRLVDGIHALGVPVRLHICGNTTPILAAIGRLGCEIVDLDFDASVAAARAAMGPEQILLGNLDPVRSVRNSAPKEIVAALEQCYRDAGPRYIVGAGCEIPRDTPPDNLRAMIRFAQSIADRKIP